jgi:hypothetical protein
MVCLRNISVDTLHKGDTEDNNDNNNNNNNTIIMGALERSSNTPMIPAGSNTRV